MTKEIQYTLEWTIKSGGLEAFKELVNTVIKLVHDNEPEMKGYQWYFNDDESKCYTAEWQTSSESLMAHLQNVGEVLPKLLQHADITRFEVFGDPSPQALEAVKGLGAVIFKYFNGFTR
jgi:hydroxylamine reductase (hybrid-cluster protein)